MRRRGKSDNDGDGEAVVRSKGRLTGGVDTRATKNSSQSSSTSCWSSEVRVLKPSVFMVAGTTTVGKSVFVETDRCDGFFGVVDRDYLHGSPFRLSVYLGKIATS